MASTLASRSHRPNVIFILADDLGWGNLIIDGQTNYETPQLDQLARDGIRFSTGHNNIKSG